MNDGGTSIAQSATNWVGAYWATLDDRIVAPLSWTTDAEVPTFSEATGKITKVDAVTPVSGVGGLAAEALPYATQLLTRLITSQFVNGRRVRGRIFIPGLSETDNTAGLPAATLRTTATTAATGLITQSTGTLAVWSRPYSALDDDGQPIPGKTPRVGSQHAVTSVSTWTQWSVLRSRRD